MTLVVASLVERSITGVSDSSKKAFRSGADMVEVRLDHVRRERMDRGTLGRVRDAIDGPAVATLRSVREGGRSTLTGVDRLHALRDILDAGFEHVDLELDTDQALLKELRRTGSRTEIIASSHFTAPVDGREFSERLSRACRAGDIGKVAMPCEDASQALMVARAGLEHRVAGDRFAAIGMGDQGQLTRVCAGRIGSEFVYACVGGRKAAPGQLETSAQRALLRPGALILGLIGHPVGHSVSRQMQEAAMRKARIEGAYLPMDIPGRLTLEDLRTMRTIGFSGVNVTIPHKRSAYDLCDERGASAAVTGSVNTVKFSEDSIFGENTDVIGFSRMIEGKIRIGAETVAVVLGAGGSARAIAHVLAGAGASVIVSARRAEAAEELADQVGAVAAEWPAPIDSTRVPEIVVNCTPVGTKGPLARATVPSGLFGRNTRFFDLVYNPPVTPSVRSALRRGAKAYSGLDMLVHQGAESFRIWTGVKPDIGIMRRAAREALR